MTIDRHGLTQLTDQDLVNRTRVLVKTGCAIEAELLLLIGEIDHRKLYLERAYSSMFAFCTGELGFSEDAAYNRITVARAARTYPAVLPELREGRVHLSGLRLLAPHLSDDNCRAVLDEARGKSKRMIEEQVARIAPKPDAPTLIRKLPRAAMAAPASAPPASTPPASTPPASTPPASTPPAALPAPVVTPAPAVPSRPTVQPLSPESYKVQFTASRELRDKLREAQDLLQHQVPGGDLAKVLERALDLLIEKVKKDRFAVGRKPRTAEPAPRAKVSRSIPAAIRREVYERDGGRCTFVDAQGRRCEETGGLEFDHLDGFARKRAHSVDRLRLACRAHNVHAAEQMYGKEHIERARVGRRAEKDRTHAATRPGASP